MAKEYDIQKYELFCFLTSIKLENFRVRAILRNFATVYRGVSLAAWRFATLQHLSRESEANGV